VVEGQDFKDKKPFYRKHLEVDDKSRIITLRLNADDEVMIRRARDLLDVEAEGKALKILARIGLNVLLNTFGDKTLKYLSSTKRERKSDYIKHQIPSNPDFVILNDPHL